MTTLTRRFPVPEFNLLRREMDRLFNDFQPERQLENAGDSVWMPRADLMEGEDAFTLILDLPGVEPDEVNLTLEENTLTISGQRNSFAEQTDDRVHRVERTFGRFLRTLQFGVPVEADGIDAAFENGVLTVTIPKSEAIKPRRIEIRSSEHGQLASGDGATTGQPALDVEVTKTES